MTDTRAKSYDHPLVNPATGRVSIDGTGLLDPIALRTEELYRPVGDETTAITTGAAKLSFHMPYDLNVTEVLLSVATAPTGQALIVDVNVDGTTIFDTGSSGVRPSIDAGETSSLTAATEFVFTSGANIWPIAKGALVTIDVDQVGSGTAGAGLKVSFIGQRP